MGGECSSTNSTSSTNIHKTTQSSSSGSSRDWSAYKPKAKKETMDWQSAIKEGDKAYNEYKYEKEQHDRYKKEENELLEKFNIPKWP